MIKSNTVKIRIDDVVIPQHFRKNIPSTQKVADRMNFYKRNKCFDRELIIDENYKIIDGYTVYLVCKMLGIETVRGLQIKVTPEKVKNKAFSLADLHRMMDFGEDNHVWVVDADEYVCPGIIDRMGGEIHCIWALGKLGILHERDYGVNWLAYPHKPELKEE